MPASTTRTPVDPASIRVLRLGHGANCSSIGSVVDTLFVTALLGGAVFAAIVGGLATEPVEVIGKPSPERETKTETRDPEAAP